MASATAEYMALFRALESTRPPEVRLFDDPYAVRFLRPSLHAVVRFSRSRFGRALVQRAIDFLWPGARASGVARTRFIDDVLVGASRDAKIEQVVLLGAGFDCRASRLSLAPALEYLEVDRPDTQEVKRERLGEGGEGAVCYVSCDFETESLSGKLAKAGFCLGRPTFFVWEGVTNYLQAQAVDDVLEYVSRAAPGSFLLFTYVDRLILDDPDRFGGSRRLRSTLRRAGEAWTFGLDPSGLADFLEPRGLRLLCDEGSIETRARYIGARGPHLRGYEFYRAALARVGEIARTVTPREGAKTCPR